MDTDGNGNTRDDADLSGSTAELLFSKSGSYDVVLTVFDQSNNSDSHAFTVTIEDAADKGSLAGILMVVLFIGAITMGVALIGHRRWQKGIAMQLLVDRGLSEPEAQAHLAGVASSRKLPLFSSAVALAGLDNTNVQSTSSKEEQAKAAEMAAIYGTEPSVAPTSQGAFAPPSFASRTVSAGSQAAAADAMALFNDESPAPLSQPVAQSPPPQVLNELTPSAPVQTVVKSGGVTLPEGVMNPTKTPPPQPAPVPEPTPQPAQTRVTCSECSTVFAIQMPAGVTKVIVACPSCSKDSTVEL